MIPWKGFHILSFFLHALIFYTLFNDVGHTRQKGINMKTTTNVEIKTRLGGGIVERQFAETISEARKLALKTKHDWQKYTRNRVEVSYIGRGGKEVYVR